jgi:ribonuclease G
MQAAFVDAGLERAAFLHASDIHNGDGARSEQITDLVREGGDVTVQVVKDPLGTKGARLTTNISIPSRYMVFMPNVSNVGVSQKIEDDRERARLREVLAPMPRPTNWRRLHRAHRGRGRPRRRCTPTCASSPGCGTRSRSAASDAPSAELIHEDLPLALRALRDLLNPEVEKVRIDSRSTWRRPSSSPMKYIPDQRSHDRVLPRRAADLRLCTGSRTRSSARCSARSSSSRAATWSSTRPRR